MSASIFILPNYITIESFIYTGSNVRDIGFNYLNFNKVTDMNSLERIDYHKYNDTTKYIYIYIYTAE